jgi:hypothetical protein
MFVNLFHFVFGLENGELRNEIFALRHQLMQRNLGKAAIASQQAQPPPLPELRQGPIDPLRRPEDDSSRGPILPNLCLCSTEHWSRNKLQEWPTVYSVDERV